MCREEKVHYDNEDAHDKEKVAINKNQINCMCSAYVYIYKYIDFCLSLYL